MKTVIRFSIVIIAACLAMQLLPWPVVVLPALSPFLAVGAAIALRRVSLVTILGLPLLLLALVKGRWFCRCGCPMGFLLDSAGSLNGAFRAINQKNKSSFTRFSYIGPWLVMLSVGSAVAGYAWFLWLDPLVLLNGFFSVWRPCPWTWMDFVPATGFSLLVLISLYQPHLWCGRICPLGAMQGLLGAIGKQIRAAVSSQTALTRSDVLPGRRAFLAILGGAGAGLLMRWIHGAPRAMNGHRITEIIRPPGAVNETQFAGLCARCGHCMRICPQRILTPDIGMSGMAGLLTPVVDLNRNYCDEWCCLCTQACPTGAIHRMSLEEKRVVSIGTAHIDTTRCMAWSSQQYCMVCNEFCPYLAIRIKKHKGVNCPEVNEAVCRGCGACQNHCPARPVKAIIVQGHPQRRIML